MAHLIPEEKIEDIPLKPERDVARALIQQLPEDCLVFHSYPWLSEDRHDIKTLFKEGEADFLILHPTAGGILVIEVKGGHIEFFSDGLCWRRITPLGERREIKDPCRQASKNLHYFESLLLRNGCWGPKSLPFSYGYAVIFPDCNFSGQAPPGCKHSNMLGEKDLPYLGRRIPEIIRKWSRQPSKITIDARDLSVIKRHSCRRLNWCMLFPENLPKMRNELKK